MLEYKITKNTRKEKVHRYTPDVKIVNLKYRYVAPAESAQLLGPDGQGLLGPDGQVLFGP